ncbi:MAG: nucleoside-diphosphate sugar epimerase/dehydratase [Nocardioides sp.]
MSQQIAALRRHRTWLLISFDVVSWLAATFGAALMRYSEPGVIPWPEVLVVGVSLAALHVGVGSLVRLHEGRARTASLEEMLLLGPVALLTGLVVSLINALSQDVARSLPLIATLGFVAFAAWGRGAWRRMVERGFQAGDARGGTRVLLVGAGEAARELIGSMLRDPESRWRPVGMIDDDLNKRHLRIRGVPVLGTISDLGDAVDKVTVASVILAIPSAGKELVREVTDLSRELDIDLKVLPAATQLLSQHVGVRDIRDLDLTDLLGRSQLDTDINSIAGYVTGRRVLVTGAGGSIGSELCRQINRFGPAELIMLDRDESALHAVQLSLNGRAMLDSDDVVLCDIRDSQSLTRIFVDRRPEVVFHAAALKHLPMLEQYPAEAVKTNVIGTRNVLEAARAAGVGRFVNISTDKAANPASVLGYSKRVAERITASYARDVHDATYVSVRFGNVLGSRGSVLTAFADQISRGGPVTVTHPDVTRYFMTIEEACQLVVQAGAIGSPGEALVLDMGDAVPILDVANQMISLSGERIEIEFTGLRGGEKLHEDLFGTGEPQDVRRGHPLISHVPVPDLDLGSLDDLPVCGSVAMVTAAMADVCEDNWTAQAVGTGSRS